MDYSDVDQIHDPKTHLPSRAIQTYFKDSPVFFLSISLSLFLSISLSLPSLCNPQTGSPYEAQAGLQPAAILPKYWDCRSVPSDQTHFPRILSIEYPFPSISVELKN